MSNTKLQEIINNLDIIAGHLSIYQEGLKPLTDMTTEQLAEWYEVLIDTIDTLEDSRE